MSQEPDFEQRGTPPFDAADCIEAVAFLRRFSEIARGQNADRLFQAAILIEALVSVWDDARRDIEEEERKVAELTSTRDQLSAEVSRLSAEWDAVNRRLAQNVDEATVERAHLQNENDQLSASLQQLQTELASARREIAEREASRRQSDDLASELLVRNGELLEQLAASKQEHSALEGRLQQMSVQGARSGDDGTRSADIVVRLQGALDRLRAQFSMLADQYEARGDLVGMVMADIGMRRAEQLSSATDETTTATGGSDAVVKRADLS